MTCSCGMDDGPGVGTCTTCADAASEAAERAWTAEHCTGLLVVDRPMGAVYAEVWHEGKRLSRTTWTAGPERGRTMEVCIHSGREWLTEAGLPPERIRQTLDLEAVA